MSVMKHKGRHATDWTWGRLLVRFYPYKVGLGIGYDWWHERGGSVRLHIGPLLIALDVTRYPDEETP